MNKIIKNDRFISFVVILSQAVFLICLKNSIILNDYVGIVIFFVLQLGLYLYIVYDKELVKRYRFFFIMSTSLITSVLYTLVYNYLLGYLYVSYVHVTGIRNPLFINNGFISNVFIIWGTIFLIYFSFLLSFLLYLIFAIKTLVAIHNKTILSIKIVSLTIFLISSFFIMHTVSKRYNDPENVNDFIKYVLYEYQYYDNLIQDNEYICANLKNITKQGEVIKVYPLFSEDKVSYVIKSGSNYKFDITECRN